MGLYLAYTHSHLTTSHDHHMTITWLFRYGVSGLMLALAYGLKFLEWWGSEGRGEDMRRAATALPPPPPPGQVQVSACLTLKGV